MPEKSRIKKIKAQYNTLKTMGDLDRWLGKLTAEEQTTLFDAMTTVSKYCGMDMRLEYVMRALGYIVQDAKDRAAANAV
jgi:hypothetical protein